MFNPVLTPALHRNKWSASFLGCFTHWEDLTTKPTVPVWNQQFLNCPVHSLVTTPNVLPWLLYIWRHINFGGSKLHLIFQNNKIWNLHVFRKSIDGLVITRVWKTTVYTNFYLITQKSMRYKETFQWSKNTFHFEVFALLRRYTVLVGSNYQLSLRNTPQGWIYPLLCSGASNLPRIIFLLHFSF